MRKIAIFIFLCFVSVSNATANEVQCGQEIKISEDFAFKGLKSRSDELSQALCQVHLYDKSDTPDYSAAQTEALKWRHTALD